MIYYTNDYDPDHGNIHCYMNLATEQSADFGTLMSILFKEVYISGVACTRHQVVDMKTVHGEVLNIIYNFYDPDKPRCDRTLKRLAKFPGVKRLAGNLPPHSED